jgi:NO-binding membrane sensor protein with MHYT domain
MYEMSGTYNGWLVAFSFAIAVLTSHTALDLAERVNANQDMARRAWLGGGGVAMGSGIWCAHYVGRLCFAWWRSIRFQEQLEQVEK